MADLQKVTPRARTGQIFMLAVLLCTLAAAVPSRALEPLFLQQALELKYDRWAQSQADTVTDVNARYDFLLQAPALSYRLGNIAFTGTLEYDRLAVGDRSDGKVGISRYGVRAFLFPYRRFHLIVDYQHSTNLAHFGTEPLRGNAYGLQYMLNSTRLPRLDFLFRQGDTTQGSAKESWTLWSLTGDKTLRRGHYRFNLTRQEMGFSGGAPDWAMNSAYFDSEVHLRENWWIRSGLDYFGVKAGDSFGGYATLNGTFKGWTSQTQVNIDEGRYSGVSNSAYSFSQSLSRTWDRWTAYASVGASTLDGGDAAGTGAGRRTAYALQTGAMVQLGRGWSALGDIALVRDDQKLASGLSGNVITYHFGVGQSGNIPSALMRPLFFVSDLSFNSRVRAEYPPGYIPSELAEVLAQRRVRQMGAAQFGLDYYNSRREGGGQRDWARISGTLKANAHIYMFIMGDWIRDRGFTVPGTSQESLSASLNMAYSLKRVTFNGAAGYFKRKDLGSVTPILDPALGRRTLYYSLGFTARFWRNTLGFLATRYDQGDGLPLTTYSAYDTFEFRRISFRVIADRSTRPDGWSVSRLSVDLLRLFDTLVFGWNGNGKP